MKSSQDRRYDHQWCNDKWRNKKLCHLLLIEGQSAASLANASPWLKNALHSLFGMLSFGEFLDRFVAEGWQVVGVAAGH